MKLFGDKETFAISYRPYEREVEPDAYYDFAYCHLILGEHFIGSKDETCLLGTWTFMLESFQSHVNANKGNMFHPLFKGLTDREVFELIRKSNQLEEEFDPAFSYLPAQPGGELWLKHFLNLDETIDAYYIVVIESEGKMKFIWEASNSPELFSVVVNYETFNSTVDSCMDYLKTIYPRSFRRKAT